MKDCIFCKIIAGDIPSKKVYEDDKVLVIMDIDPKADGHTLVIPKKHVTDFTEMSDEDVLMVNGIAKKVGLKIVDRLKARGITFAVNYGDSQAVKHYHLHLLPNYTIEEMSGRTVEEIYDIIKGDF